VCETATGPLLLAHILLAALHPWATVAHPVEGEIQGRQIDLGATHTRQAVVTQKDSEDTIAAILDPRISCKAQIQDGGACHPKDKSTGGALGCGEGG